MEEQNQKDEELLKDFIGQNYDEIMRGGFSIPGFFLTSIYFFYRGMLSQGLSLFIVRLFVIVLIQMHEIFAVLFLGINIFAGLYANKLYVSFAKKKISSIKELYYDKSFEELKSICVRDGGVSITYIFMGFFACGALFLFFFLMLLFMYYN